MTDCPFKRLASLILLYHFQGPGMSIPLTTSEETVSISSHCDNIKLTNGHVYSMLYWQADKISPLYFQYIFVNSVLMTQEAVEPLNSTMFLFFCLPQNDVLVWVWLVKPPNNEIILTLVCYVLKTFQSCKSVCAVVRKMSSQINWKSGSQDSKDCHWLCITEDCAFNNRHTLCQIPLMYKWWVFQTWKASEEYAWYLGTETHRMIVEKVRTMK